MKFINVIREGDFVRLKTLEQLEKEFGKAGKGGAIGSLFFGEMENFLESFFVNNDVRKELGNVLRIKRVEISDLTNNVFFHAESNGIAYEYEDEDVVFDKKIVDAVLINGKWYQADEPLNVFLI